MNSVKIHSKLAGGGDFIGVSTPYHPDFASRAKRLGGKWSPSAREWTFDRRDEAKVRALCIDLFGTDGTPIPASELRTVRAPISVCDKEENGTSYWLCGRKVASVAGRDSGARLAEGVVIVQGDLDSGGSKKNPIITATVGTVIELRDVPRAKAEELHGQYHGVTLLDAAGNVIAEPTCAKDEETNEPTDGLVFEEEREEERREIDHEIAAAEGRLAGLRFRAAELRA